MKKGLLLAVFWVFCLAAFSQNQPHLSFAEKEDLKGYEFIGDIDYLLVRVIGETGNNVMMRLMGLILMVIAVECFVGGMKPILIDIIQESRL